MYVCNMYYVPYECVCVYIYIYVCVCVCVCVCVRTRARAQIVSYLNGLKEIIRLWKTFMYYLCGKKLYSDLGRPNVEVSRSLTHSFRSVLRQIRSLLANRVLHKVRSSSTPSN